MLFSISSEVLPKYPATSPRALLVSGRLSNFLPFNISVFILPVKKSTVAFGFSKAKLCMSDFAKLEKIKSASSLDTLTLSAISSTASFL